jgi:hypothetical protein
MAFIIPWSEASTQPDRADFFLKSRRTPYNGQVTNKTSM